MNIFVFFVLLSFLDAPTFDPDARAVRRFNKAKAIARKRRVGRSAIGATLWFDEPEQTFAHTWCPHPEVDGLYIHGAEWKPRQKHSNSQQNRWDTFEWKQRSYIYNGRVHVGDRNRKGKRLYAGEKIDKIRFNEALKDYYYGEA